jgi:hypothetical protein
MNQKTTCLDWIERGWECSMQEIALVQEQRREAFRLD